MFRFLIIYYYILNCCKIGAKPWLFFQLNAQYFNEEKGVFSKYELENLIPEKWKPDSILLENTLERLEKRKKILSQMSYPFFLKPEWGQNSYGVFCIENEEMLNHALEKIEETNIPYICQKVANGKKEIDVFYVKSPLRDYEITNVAVIDLYQPKNVKIPINGIYSGTQYFDITENLSKPLKENIVKHIGKIGDFSVTRISVKTDSIEAFSRGEFEIFEMNVFVPMPVHLLDTNKSFAQQKQFIREFTQNLALLTKKISKETHKSIFWRKTKMHFKLKTS